MAVEERPSAAFPSSFAVQRTEQHASRLRIPGALPLGIFEQPSKMSSAFRDYGMRLLPAKGTYADA
jgi:hypothetical protein